MPRAPDPTLPPWPQYAASAVEITAGDAVLVITPVGPDDASPEPDDADRLPGALPGGGTIWVLTAGDPYPETLGAAENAERNARLRAALVAEGLEVMPALGRALDGPTSEVSLAVHGTDRARVDRARVLAHAAAFDQLAVYELDRRLRCIDVASGHVVTDLACRLTRRPATT